MAEKCIRQLPPVRVPESLEHALMRLAAHEDRPLSEYVRGRADEACVWSCPHGGA